MSRYKRYSNPYSVDVQRYSIYGIRPSRNRSIIQPGDEFVIVVDDMDSEGRGIARRGNYKILVPRAVPGEKVRVRVVKVIDREAQVSVIERLAEPKR